SEDFLLHDFHLFVGVDQNGGFDEIAGAIDFASTDNGFGSFLSAGIEVSADALLLLDRDQRSHLRVLGESGTELYLLCGGGHALDDLVEDCFFDIEAGSGAAALSVVEEDGAGGTGDGGVQVGITQDDVGRFATEFQRYFLEIAGSGVQDQFAHFRGSGEGNLIDIGMGGEGGTRGFAITRDDVDDPVGESSLKN